MTFVQVRGVEGVHQMLQPWLEPELSRHLDAATKAAAKFLAGHAKTEARPVSRRMAKAVRVRRARKDRPGWVVGSRRKTPPGAFWWHMVIGGTRDHIAGRGVRVRGVKANPIVKRVADRYGAQAYDTLNRALPKETR